MSLKVGSIVRPTVGPHKNQAHEVVHIFEDGHANIRPVEGEVLYEEGVVTCDPKYLCEDFLVEEYEEPSGYWFTSMSETAKKAYRKEHPHAQGTFGHPPGSTKYHREKSNAHLRYANFHKARYDRHDGKYAEESAKRHPNHEVLNHHSMSKDGHAQEFHNHTMASAHHESLAVGGRPSHDRWLPKHPDHAYPTSVGH
jgi:hypothetical protein